MTPRFRRDLGIFERWWPWLGASALGAGGAVTIAALAAEGQLDKILGGGALDHQLRGHTLVGLSLGIIAAALAVVAVAYSLRKRPLQERLSTGGSMTAWLWLHVAAGTIALAAAVAHAGYGLVSAQISTGKVVFAIFALLALSGIAWRVVYRVVPPVAAAKVGDYSELASARRADDLLTEIEKTAAGGSAELHRLKAWMVEAERTLAEVGAASSALDPREQEIVAEIHRLAASRRRALAKQRLKARYTRLLQAWRVAHVPLTFLLLPALIAHIVGSLDLPAKALAPGDAPVQMVSGFQRSKDCASCHRAIYEQWTTSMHAHALTSPVMIAQNNQLVAAELGKLASPDPKRFCVNCHGPVGVALSARARLPLRRSGFDDAFLDEGVGCSACHQWRGKAEPGLAGFSRFQDGLRPGSTYYGQIDDPVGNAFHRSAPAGVLKRDGELCSNCHNVQYDTDGDKKIVKGVDLVLQTTTQEFDDYVAKGGKGTCVSCHMPVMAGALRAAERASLVTEQDRKAPAREVHDHSFVGVDYPIDEVARKDPARPAREALLRGAARLELDARAVTVKEGKVSFTVAITNSGVGHNLPSGFAFARQMWLEVKVIGAGNQTLLQSGVLARASDDLCDAGTLDEPGNPAKAFIVGCRASDPDLVSFQQKLVDRIDVERDRAGAPKRDARGEQRAVAARGAKETWIQHLSSGAVARVRPRDGAVLAPIVPGETRKLGYAVEARGHAKVTVSVRLLFRSLPPYMLRALGSGQPANEAPLAPLVENLQVVEMATKSIVVDVGTR